MAAQRLTIEGKVRPFAGAIVRLDHFKYREAEEVDAQMVVEQPTISLYCLDHDNRRAIFVETPPDVDLTQAPFYNIVQYDAAESLIAVSYDTLHQLAADIVVDPRRIILLYSVGRCGSTLVSHALSQADGVYGMSEPDVFTQLRALQAPDGSNDAEVSDLVRDCVKVMCAPARSEGATAWVLKLKSLVIGMGDMLNHHFPEAKVIFLYRNAEGWAKSQARAFGHYEAPFQKAAARSQQVFARLNPLVRSYMATRTTAMSPIELLSCNWVAVMERCLELQRQGVPMFCMRYEDLQAAPQEMLDALLAFCDLTVHDPSKIDRVLAQDSQTGTRISRASLRDTARELPEHDLPELRRLIHHLSPTLNADTVVPHTFSPMKVEIHGK